MKRNRKVKPIITLSIAPTQFDQGATGPANVIGLASEDRPDVDVDQVTGKITRSNPNGRRGKRRVPWVETYTMQGKISGRQYMAALALFDASEGMPARDPLCALSIDKASAPYDPQAARVDARATFRRLWAAVPEHCRPIVHRVVIENVSAWQHGGEAVRRHMARLSVGLDAVADATDRRRA